MEIYIFGIYLAVSGFVFILSPFWLSSSNWFVEREKNKDNFEIFSQWVKGESDFKNNLITDKEWIAQQGFLKKSYEKIQKNGDL
jgi:hypothetical protein